LNRHLCICVAAILVGLTPAAAKPSTVSRTSSQRFACHEGFTLEECRSLVMILRAAVEKYPLDQLGEWTWVVVRTRDWKHALTVRGLDPDSPALTYLPGNETFFDEALMMRASIRGMELMDVWNMPIDELLDKTVRHEVAHALCKEKDEMKVGRLEQQLRDHKTVACAVKR
jgi:hypothetical protein